MSYVDVCRSLKASRGPITLAPLDNDDVPRLRELMRTYRDLPMDLADAALVHVAGRERFTILPAPVAVASPRPRAPRTSR